MAQAGALLAVVVGGIAVAPAVALADPPDVQITNLPTEVGPGSPITMQYTVADRNNGEGRPAGVVIRVNSEMRCSQDCSQLTQVDRNGRQFTAQFTAPTVNAGEVRQVRIEVSATIDGETETVDATVTVKGPERPQNVRQISGKVKNQDGKAIAGATVAIKDSSGNTDQTTSNGSGGYSFTSSDSHPIVPGTVTVGAGKNGYDPAQVTVQAIAGRTVTVGLTLKAIETEPSPTPSPTASESAPASAAPADENTEPAGPTTAAVQPEQKAASEDSGGGSMWFIILGALLVAAGVGAIVLVFLRRRAGVDDDGDDPTALPGGGGGVVPPSQGRFHDATRVGAPVAAATMVAPPLGSPSMADAPTVLQRPVPAVEDEFPDPYGAPMPQQQPGGYAGAGGWNTQPGGGYGTPTQYQPAADDGYGTAAGGGYGYEAAPPADQRRYDEPTGLYVPEQDAAGYGDYDQGGYGGGQYGTPQHGTPQHGATEYGATPYGAAQHGGGYGEPEPADQGGWTPAADGGGTYGTYGAGAPAGQYGGGQQYGGYGDGEEQQPAGHDERAGYDPQGGYRDQYDEPTGYDPHGYRGGQSR